MGPKKRGAATKRGATKASKSEPPAKLSRNDSGNTELRKKINEIKKAGKASSEGKKYKCDQSLIDMNPAATIYKDYACMLNQTNISANNNKFYVIQLAEDPDDGYLCFTKWGRVGEMGQANGSEVFDKLEDAVKWFEKKFKDKTKNNWKDRENFKPVPGKYTLLEMDCDSEDEDETDSNTMAVTTTTKTLGNAKIKCTLDIRTQLLIKLIFNDDMFVAQMSSMNLNVNKMPLGKLSQSQIAKGLEVLLDLEKGIKSNTGDLADLTSKFYTVIPHDFGRSKPPIIASQAIVDQKKEMMMTLSDIELTQALQKKQVAEPDAHPLDLKYQKLNASLEYLDKKGDEFKLLEKYSKACPNTRKGPLLDAWRVDRDGERVRFATHDDIKYRKLLWHGTNVAVVAAILNSGLRIMPHSGGLVGRGIYFASEHAKSSWYVGAHYGKFEGETNIGFMFLVEVALGNIKSITQSDGSLRRAPPGFDSIVARGSSEPDVKQNKYLEFDGKEVEVPVGKPVPVKEWKNSGFVQSEYLVYKESQARIRYILKYSFT